MSIWGNTNLGINPDFRTGHLGKNLVFYHGVAGLISSSSTIDIDSMFFFNPSVFGRMTKISFIFEFSTLASTTTFNIFWRGGHDFEKEIDPLSHEFITGVTATTTSSLGTAYLQRDGTTAISGPGGGNIEASPSMFDMPWIGFGVKNTGGSNLLIVQVTAFGQVV